MNQNLVQKNETFLHKIEKIGYKSANGIHKFFVLGMFTFIAGNFVYFLKEYNAYWRARRVNYYYCYYLNFKQNPDFIFDMERNRHAQNK